MLVVGDVAAEAEKVGPPPLRAIRPAAVAGDQRLAMFLAPPPPTPGGAFENRSRAGAWVRDHDDYKEGAAVFAGAQGKYKVASRGMAWRAMKAVTFETSAVPDVLAGWPRSIAPSPAPDDVLVSHSLPPAICPSRTWLSRGGKISGAARFQAASAGRILGRRRYRSELRSQPSAPTVSNPGRAGERVVIYQRLVSAGRLPAIAWAARQ